MRERHATSVVVLAAIAIVGGAFRSTNQRAAPQPPDATGIVTLFRAYATGDVEVVARTLTTREAFPPEIRGGPTGPLDDWIEALRREWRGDWRPVQPTFVLELAVAASKIQLSPRGAATLDSTTKRLLAAGAQRVSDRPTKVGTNADDDRFETTWHKAAAGVLEGLPPKLPEDTPEFIVSYVSEVEKRYHAAHAHDLDGWMALTRGVAMAPRRQQFRSSGRYSIETQLDTLDLYTAIQFFEKASRHAEVRDEADVRRAFLLLQTHRADAGLRALADVADNPRDLDRTYWAHLIRAQLLDAKRRFDEGAQEYRAALSARPRTQAAGLGLTLDLIRTGHRSDADAVATDTITAPKSVLDPWWRFDFADERFVPDWLAELRGYRR